VGKFANSHAEINRASRLCAEAMGEEYDNNMDVGSWTGPTIIKQDWNGQSGFDAMGHRVPAFRRAEAERHMKAMGFTNAEQRYDVVACMSDKLERGKSHEALELALKKGVDTTGCYRLMAVLLCHPLETAA